MTESQRHLEAAVGYLQLGLLEDANEEIEQLASAEKTSPGVLRLRAAIYMQMNSWDLLREVAGFLVENIPQDSQHWIWHAYATRRVTSINEAEEILLRAVESHPQEAMIHFNLACYAAQTGKLEEARGRLEEAIRLAPEVRAQALDDPDLEPLW